MDQGVCLKKGFFYEQRARRNKQISPCPTKPLMRASRLFGEARLKNDGEATLIISRLILCPITIVYAAIVAVDLSLLFGIDHIYRFFVA